jgi:hypothetical protein
VLKSALIASPDAYYIGEQRGGALLNVHRIMNQRKIVLNWGDRTRMGAGVSTGADTRSMVRVYLLGYDAIENAQTNLS